MENLLKEIRRFCKTTGMSRTRFGELALNDKAFVHQLEKNRRVWPETEKRVQDFMKSYRAEPKAKAA